MTGVLLHIFLKKFEEVIYNQYKVMNRLNGFMIYIGHVILYHNVFTLSRANASLVLPGPLIFIIYLPQIYLHVILPYHCWSSKWTFPRCFPTKILYSNDWKVKYITLCGIIHFTGNFVSSTVQLFSNEPSLIKLFQPKGPHCTLNT